MKIEVTSKDVISTLVVIGLNVTITKDENEFDLELNVRYDQACNMGYTDISWEVVDGDDSILEQDDINNQLDDFVQEYVLENIGKL